MIAATRRWFRRNRTNLLVGAGVIGAGYVAGQYVLGKIQEARQRMGEERIAKEKYGILSRWRRLSLTSEQPPSTIRTEPGRLYIHRSGTLTNRA